LPILFHHVIFGGFDVASAYVYSFWGRVLLYQIPSKPPNKILSQTIYIVSYVVRV